jgi:hypothetical protein
MIRSNMATSATDCDVVVLGDHPCTFVAAILLRKAGVKRVRHLVIPTDTTPSRPVLVNPDIFAIDKVLAGWQKDVPLTPVQGVHFLGDDAGTHNRHDAGRPIAFVARMEDLTDTVRPLAKEAGVTLGRPASLKVVAADPTGVDLLVDDKPLRAKALIVGGDLPVRDKQLLGIFQSWDGDVQRRVCYTMLPRPRSRASSAAAKVVVNGEAARVIPMSLDLGGTRQWAWMLTCSRGTTCLVVDGQADGKPEPASRALQRWADVLATHKVIERTTIDPTHVQTMTTAAAGSLAHDNVANRTLLIGPAGGFFSASGEDVYPNCWSAQFAATVLAKALKQPLLQDALDTYRSCWRTTLGLYLQGPQQNLQFLLPMVHRNAAMASRLAEAILVGTNVVR